MWEQEEMRSTNVVDDDTARRNSGKKQREEERDVRIKKGNKQDRKCITQNCDAFISVYWICLLGTHFVAL